MHAKGNGDVCRFTEGRVLGSVMAFAEMIHTIAIEREDQGNVWAWVTTENSQISNYDMH